LIAPLEVALLETPVNTDGEAVRDTSGNGNDLFDADISKGGIDNIRWETEESLSDLASTGVLVVKSSDEEEGITPEVDLIMDRTFGEKGSLTLRHGVDDEASSVLLNEPSFHLAVNNEQELGCSGMGVGGVHSARCHLTDSHSHAIRKKCREIGDIGDGEVSTGGAGSTDPSIVIEQPVSVVLEDVETSDLSGCPLQIGHEIGGFGGISGLSDSLESGSKDERDGSDELHDG